MAAVLGRVALQRAIARRAASGGAQKRAITKLGNRQALENATKAQRGSYLRSQAAHALANPITTLYQAEWALNAVRTAANLTQPTGAVAIKVRVTGSWWSTLTDLLALAMGVAVRRLPNLGGVHACAFQADIDYTNKVVTVELAYTASALAGNIPKVGGGESVDSLLEYVRGGVPTALGWTSKFPDFMGGGSMPLLNNDTIANASQYNGSSEDIYKGTVSPILINQRTGFRPATFSTQIGNAVGAVIGLGASMIGANVQVQPVFASDQINPFPEFDGVSRSSDFTAILMANLTNPCDVPKQPVSVSYFPPTETVIKTPIDSKLKVPPSSGLDAALKNLIGAVPK